MTLISYIVPAYNIPAHMLTECIDSILAVGLDDSEREVIVIDDGSDVPCADTLKRYARRVSIVRQDNQGLSVARNTGIARARGEYLHFVDADDMLVRSAYDECVRVLKAERPDVLMFGFTTNAADTAPRRQRRSGAQGWWHTYATGADHMIANNLQVASCCYIARRATVGDMRFVPQLKNEDERFTTPLMLRAGKTIVASVPAYYYRQREGSLQHSYDAAFVQARLADYASTLCHFAAMPAGNDTQRRALQRRVSQMTMDYLYNTITLTRSRARLHEAVRLLRDNGLMPMPHVRYTTKYLLFSHLANTALGRALLLLLLPLLPREV